MNNDHNYYGGAAPNPNYFGGAAPIPPNSLSQNFGYDGFQNYIVPNPAFVQQQQPSLLQQQNEDDDEQHSDNNQIAEHSLELASILLSADGQFLSIMRSIEPVQTAAFLFSLLDRFWADSEMTDGSERQPDDELSLLRLMQILPKCDEVQIHEVGEFLVIEKARQVAEQLGNVEGQQQSSAVVDSVAQPAGSSKNRQQIDSSVNLEIIDCLPFDALTSLLAQNSVERVGEEAAHALRSELMECGILAILLDALSFYSQQPNRFDANKQLGFIEFKNCEIVEKEKLLPKYRTQPNKNKRPRPVSAARARSRKRPRFQGLSRANSEFIKRVNGEYENCELLSQRKNEKCTEALLKVLNNFLLDSEFCALDVQWLSLLFRSSLRNIVRAYLMNGDLGDVVRLSTTYGVLFQLLSTFAGAAPVFVSDLSEIYDTSDGNKQNSGAVNSSSKSAEGVCCTTLLHPFDVILGEDTNEQNDNNSVESAAAPCSSLSIASAPSTAKPIVEQLNGFARKIDDHFKLLSSNAFTAATAQNSQDNWDGAEELMTLNSLSSLCETIIRMIEQQNSILFSDQNQQLNKKDAGSSSETNESQCDPLVKEEGEEEADRSNTRKRTRKHEKTSSHLRDKTTTNSDFERDPLPDIVVPPLQTLQTASDGADVVVGQQQSASSSETKNLEEDLTSAYCESLRELQFATIPFDGFELISHHFRKSFGTGASMGMANQRIKRIGKELFALRSDLPLTLSSSVFVRTSEEHMEALKVLIIGPEGTPYENGCFEFDFFLGPEFPQSPPKVQFITTGNGSVRFNPNLYNSGKVCLSLLGTWPGDNRAQEWNAQSSTINQVITSIQGLILVPDPYFNEPGFERMRNTPAGKKSSTIYNANIEDQTLRWAIIEQLRHPPPGFAEVVNKHFYMKRAQIRAQVARWGESNSRVLPQYAYLEKELCKLEKQFAKNQN